jgi:hypothetical protein
MDLNIHAQGLWLGNKLTRLCLCISLLKHLQYTCRQIDNVIITDRVVVWGPGVTIVLG